VRWTEVEVDELGALVTIIEGFDLALGFVIQAEAGRAVDRASIPQVPLRGVGVLVSGDGVVAEAQRVGLGLDVPLADEVCSVAGVAHRLGQLTCPRFMYQLQ
jgi:hypothetical protein